MEKKDLYLLKKEISYINEEVQQALKDSTEFNDLHEFESFQEMLDCLFGYGLNDLKEEVLESWDFDSELSFILNENGSLVIGNKVYTFRQLAKMYEEKYIK